jgi:cellulose synthase/poly-beta-1,6-N-acetylglucosamine synthase-like glycosyltransferase
MNHATPARFLAAHEATAPTPLLPLLPPLPADRDARRLWRQLPPPQAALRSIVIIPAKDEAANLPVTLAALAAQVDAQGQPLPAGSFEVIVLANNCQDATASVVRQQAKRWPHLRLHVKPTLVGPAAS